MFITAIVPGLCFLLLWYRKTLYTIPTWVYLAVAIGIEFHQKNLDELWYSVGLGHVALYSLGAIFSLNVVVHLVSKRHSLGFFDLLLISIAADALYFLAHLQEYMEHFGQ